MERFLLAFTLLFGLALPQSSLADPTSEEGGGVEEAMETGSWQASPEDTTTAAEPAKADEPGDTTTAADPAKAVEPEEPKAEEPKAEEPKAEEPKAEPVPDVKSHLQSDDEAMAAATQLMDAAKGGKWVLVVGLLISLLLYAARRFKILNKVPSKLVPILAALLGVLWYVVPELMRGGENWQEALTSGLLAGLTAVGSWEVVAKGLLKKKAERT